MPVLLQAMKEDPPLDAKCRDKFLVQSVAISADKEYANVSSVVCCATLSYHATILIACSGHTSSKMPNPLSRKRRSASSSSQQTARL